MRAPAPDFSTGGAGPLHLEEGHRAVAGRPGRTATSSSEVRIGSFSPVRRIPDVLMRYRTTSCGTNGSGRGDVDACGVVRGVHLRQFAPDDVRLGPGRHHEEGAPAVGRGTKATRGGRISGFCGACGFPGRSKGNEVSRSSARFPARGRPRSARFRRGCQCAFPSLSSLRLGRGRGAFVSAALLPARTRWTGSSRRAHAAPLCFRFWLSLVVRELFSWCVRCQTSPAERTCLWLARSRLHACRAAYLHQHG